MTQITDILWQLTVCCHERALIFLRGCREMPFCNFKLAIIELVWCSHIFIERVHCDSYFERKGEQDPGPAQ